MKANKEEVASFLKDARSLIDAGEVLIVKRTINLQDIADIGLTMKGVKQELCDLTEDNYSKGPELDRDFPGDIWVFGKKIIDQEVYIKLKIDKMGKNTKLTCISFHIAKYKIDYPYKE